MHDLNSKREARAKHIKRKKRILKQLGIYDYYYKFDGQLSKGKIHCSCAMCTYGKTYGLATHKDKIANEIFKSQMQEIA